jgi:hypothetical protein
MKLAILGTETEILRLAAAARDQQHEIVWLGDIRSADVATLAALDAQLPDRSAEWELLLDREIVDAVLIGRGTASNELRAEQIKRLAAEGVPLLIAHPAFDSVLPYYEVDMVRRESGAIVQHYNPLIGHPLTQELAEWAREGHHAIGKIHQLSCERQVAAAAREQVLAHFAQDVELLAAVAGDIGRVTAIGPTGRAASFASLQIQLSAGGPVSMRWSVGYAATGGERLELSLLGEHGIVTVRISNGDESAPPTWQLEITEEGVGKVQPLESYDPAYAAIVQLSDAIGQSQVERRASASTWDAATRAVEVVDAAELSLQKGRTIEVYQQQLTERLAFRGTMAAIGCGLLFIAFAAVVVVAILGGAEGLVRQRIVPSWPLVLLAVLAFFLLLQAVPLLARKPNHDRTESRAIPPDKRDT